jgi:hypothetical protein
MLIYIVEAQFQSYESSWSNIIGIFNDKDIADDLATKWSNFYKNHVSIFDGLDYDDNDDDDKIDEYYRIYGMYGEVRQFTHVSVTEVPFNRDIYTTNTTGTFRTESIQRLISEWDRDYKIDKILE